MRAIFLHHSVGANLVREGQVRKHLSNKRPSLEFWDHGYNLFLHQIPYAHHTGLVDNQGKVTHHDFNIPSDNTDPDGLAAILNLNPLIPAQHSLKKLLEFDLIIVKSCYPNTRIKTNQQLQAQKSNYLTIRNFIQQQTQKRFLIVTSPPLRKELTKAEYSNRAREIANWLVSREFNNLKNLSVFNLFDLLANSDNFLKSEYCRIFPWDSHPNLKANQLIGREFADFICKLDL